MIGQFQVLKLPYGHPALDHLFKTGIINKRYIINILLASFARSVRQVMDPRFFLPCFHGPRASRLSHTRKEKTWCITCRTGLAIEGGVCDCIWPRVNRPELKASSKPARFSNYHQNVFFSDLLGFKHKPRKDKR